MKRALIISAILLSSLSFGQLTTAVGSPAGLVQNVLLGPGVTVSNISFTGSAGAIGSFTANNTNLGLQSGIVMTTGTVLNNGNGPHGPNNSPSSGVETGAPGSGLLNSIVGGTTYDASTLEFDFVPYADTVRFRYVFGSEEYPEYVGSAFNDVFGFFISGPGIAGQQNIARIPGSGQVVAINNVHNTVTNGGVTYPAQNAAYYVDNTGGATIQYDGFTTVLEAFSPVQCGQTYHLIISIADVADMKYDSGIFLEANSLTSKTPVDIDLAVNNPMPGTTYRLAEGCSDGTFTLTRSSNINQSLTIPINATGTATELLDYTDIPNSVTFNPGQTQIQFSFSALQDFIAEGVESATIEFILTDPCGNQTPLPFTFEIADTEPLQVVLNDTSVVCSGDVVNLIPTFSGGVGPFTYSWNTGESTPSISVSPTSTTSYSVQIVDGCTNDAANASATVTVPVYPPISLTVSPDVTEICPYITHDLSVAASGGAGNYSYAWTSSVGNFSSVLPDITVTPAQTTTYTVQVTDQCGEQAQANILYTITSPPLIVTMSPVQRVCPYDSAFIEATATGGFGQHYFFWTHSGETTSGVWVNPGVTTSYQCVVSDECQTFSVPGITTVIVQKPTANFQVSSRLLFDDVPITFQNLSSGAITYTWDFGDGQTSTAVHPNNVYNDPGYYEVELVATDDLGCRDTITKPINILEAHYIYVPNTFTPDGDRINNEFFVSVYGIRNLEIEIYNRWGERIFKSDDMNFRWDGTFQGVPIQDGTYVYKIKFLANNGTEDEILGHVNLLR